MANSREPAVARTHLSLTPQYGRDESGFLDPVRSLSLLDSRGLLEHPAVLIKAQPWMGKSTFARQTHARLGEDLDKNARFDAFLELTCFAEDINVTQLLPPWWGRWNRSLPSESACWIIDGLDECELDNPDIPKRIVRAIAEVPAKSHRSKLRLIVLGRDRDLLKEFENELRPLYAEIGTDGPLVLRMAPRDCGEAANMLRSSSAFEKSRKYKRVGNRC